MDERRRFEQSMSLRKRLLSFAREMIEKASRVPPLAEKTRLGGKARRTGTASTQVENWANSSELRPPD
jgi:hypothetical protein